MPQSLLLAIGIGAFVVYLVGVLTSKAAVRAADSLVSWIEDLIGKESRLATAGVRRALGSMIHHKPHHMTEIDWTLRLPDNWPDPDSTGPPELYDFAAEERILRREGVFVWLRIPPEYLPESLVHPFTEDIADQYLEDAHRFFARRVEIHAGENNFYEDEEGAVIVSMFRRSDRRCFYAIDQLRRVIDGNARKLIVRQTLALWLVFFLITFLYYLSPIRPFYGSEPSLFPAVEQPVETLVGRLEANVRYGVMVVVVLVAGGIGVVFLNMQRFYATQQQHNMRELSDFLTRYLSLINNRFREANANASRVVQGDERDSKKLGEGAKNIQLITIWLGFRPFFIEAFVRNEYFQIRRNLGYWLIAGFFVCGVSGLLSWWFFSRIVLHVSWNSMESVAIAVLALFVSAFSFLKIRKKEVLIELNQTNWLGYDHLEVGKQLGEVVRKYAEDIGQRKNSNRGFE